MLFCGEITTGLEFQGRIAGFTPKIKLGEQNREGGSVLPWKIVGFPKIFVLWNETPHFWKIVV